MKTARRRTLPVPLLFALAILLFTAGLGTGWSGASAYADRGLPAARPTPADAAEPVPNAAVEPTQDAVAESVQDAAAEPLHAEPAQDAATGPAQDAAVEPTPDAAGPTQDAGAPSPQPTASPSDKPSPAPPDADDWNLILVNFENPLPDGFTAPDLTQLRNGHAVDSRAYPALQRMLDDARAAGLQPVICSSFRSWDTQVQLYEAEVQNWLDRGYIQEDAEARAAMWVARPGTSEHQIGLAVDIVDLSYQLLNEAQENTPVQQWLTVHCAEYGFILRYPADKSGLTGVGYEPWHYRYVGEEAAREIMEDGLCLEEYLTVRESANLPIL